MITQIDIICIILTYFEFRQRLVSVNNLNNKQADCFVWQYVLALCLIAVKSQTILLLSSLTRERWRHQAPTLLSGLYHEFLSLLPILYRKRKAAVSVPRAYSLAKTANILNTVVRVPSALTHYYFTPYILCYFQVGAPTVIYSLQITM